MTSMLPAGFLDFVALFNRGAFWESHEVLEGPWLQNRSDFYKGMILYASAWVHVQRGNARGTIAQLRKAERHLDAYRPAYLGVDVDALLAHAERSRLAAAADAEALRAAREAQVPPIRIALAPERIRGDEPELADGRGGPAPEKV